MNGIGTIPDIRTPYSIKIGDSDEGKTWREHSVDFYIENASFEDFNATSLSESNLLRYYQYYNGDIPQSEFKYVLNPYNATDPRNKQYPARLRNFNIIKPAIRLLMSEGDKRPKQLTVYSKSPSSVSSWKEHLNKKVQRNVLHTFVNDLINLGVIEGDKQDAIPFDKIKDVSFNDYADSRAANGQEALTYVLSNTKFWEKKQESLKDWLIAGQTYTYKDVINGEVESYTIRPPEIDYDRSKNNELVEDGDWVVRATSMKLSEVVDKFSDKLTDDDLDILDNDNLLSGTLPTLVSMYENADEFHNNPEIPVFHVVWKTLKKLYLVAYQDELTGDVETFTVEEEDWIGEKEMKKIFGKVFDFEVKWINETWEGYRIGTESQKIYKMIAPIAIQRRPYNNPAECKLPYNGVKMNSIYAATTSLVKEGIPYQILFNILHYRWELAIAKYKGSIILMDINAVPKIEGWDAKHFMYTVDSSGFAFIDGTAENAEGTPSNFREYKVLNTEVGNFIASLFDAMRLVKNEWEEQLGLNPQRKGQTSAHERVTNAQQNLVQSSLMTEEIFRVHEAFVNTDLTGLLDLTPHAWKEGKQAFYRTWEGHQNILDLTGDDLVDIRHSDLGVYTANGGEEMDKVNMLHTAALESAARHGGDVGTLAEILDLKNFAKIKQVMAKVKEQEQALVAQEQEFLASQEQAKQQFELVKLDKEIAGKLEIEQRKIDADLLKAGNDSNANAIPDTTEVQKLADDRTLKQQELGLKAQEQKDDKQLKEKELKLKEKEIDTNLKIAKENKNQFDSK